MKTSALSEGTVCGNDELIAIKLMVGGLTVQDAMSTSLVLLPRKGGRPSTAHVLAVKALEEKIAHQHLSWNDVTDRVCTCGSDDHNRCVGRLQIAARGLRGLLAKYGLPTFKFDAQGHLLENLAQFTLHRKDRGGFLPL